MGLLSNPLSPVAPYASAIKMGGLILAGLAVLGMAITIYVQSVKIEGKNALLDTIASTATMATVEPDEDGKRRLLKHKQLPAAVAALANSFQSAMGTLRTISRESDAAKARSDARDAALSTRIDEMQVRSAKTDPAWDPWGDQ